MDISNYEVILTEIAKEDLEFIYDYIYETLHANKAANNLMNKIEKNILLLENNPYAGVEICVKPHNEMYRKLIVNNYIILYQVEEEYKQVVIYKIVYSKTDYIRIEE